MCFCGILGHRHGHVLILFHLETFLLSGFALALCQHAFVMAVYLPSRKL